jgi:hypothetical protein
MPKRKKKKGDLTVTAKSNSASHARQCEHVSHRKVSTDGMLLDWLVKQINLAKKSCR